MQVVRPRTCDAGGHHSITENRKLWRSGEVAGESSLPGVTSVGLVDTLPLNFNGNTDWIRFVGRAFNGGLG